ncbi:hypothetical protein [Kutzneria albida]|uniref:DUF4435 domain-containing protein n=1 Tax=Kutzneria albida DSM 43870 TaxID=1449976 RepID=W5VZA3_9PSEU|nr:hypothetical protein [Kutzneria albida]AHH94243.1 hypothetical protein KALB_869 [Kutzneria albida DSM 43870]
MAKLNRDPASFRRRLQMASSDVVFVFIEGKETDPWFYDEILSNHPKLQGVQIAVLEVEHATKNQGTPKAGGKGRALTLYEELRRSNGLLFDDNGRTRAVMFCLDADHDRILNKVRRSRHITYTLLPDSEAHVYDSCSIGEIARSVMSLTAPQAKAVESSLGDYRYELFKLWENWLALCWLSSYLDFTWGIGPGAISQINGKNSFDACDEAKLSSMRSALLKRCSPQASSIKEYESHVAAILKRLHIPENSKKCLKGKWLTKYLFHRLNAYADTHRHKKVASQESIIVAARSCAKLNGKWNTYLVNRVAALVN